MAAGPDRLQGPDEAIEIVGARTHNLRDVSVRIPKGRVVAVTGVSGSGKTSLAIDTLHAEAQLRYLEGLSPFVRQYLTQRSRPQVDRIGGLTATLAVDQRRLSTSPRSTIATLTGIDGYLGLLYSRLPGLTADLGRPLSTTHFDRHAAEGRCRECHGAGGRWRASEESIITRPDLPLLDGASPWFAKWRSGEHAFVPALAAMRRVDLAQPWEALPERFRHEVLHGTGDEGVEATVDMPNKNETASWTYTTTKPLRGALAEVERVFAQATTATAKQRYLRYLRTTSCPGCGGTGFGEDARTITLGGVTYVDLVDRELWEVREWSDLVRRGLRHAHREVGAPLLDDLDRRLELTCRFGLAHLQLSRTATSLSGGERQRTRLAGQLSTELSGITFVLDEPGSGLHPADKDHLSDIARQLCAAGNTVVLVEHDPEVIARADWVVDMGPGAGRHGGSVVFSGPPAGLAAEAGSVTGRHLAERGHHLRRDRRRIDADTSWLTLHGIRVHSLEVDRVGLPLGRLTCLTGVSGSGKSSLLVALAEGVAAAVDGRRGVDRTTGTDRLEGVGPIGWVTVVDQEPIGRTPRSNPATYSKAFDLLRALFAATPAARDRGLTASWFSFNAADGGRCTACAGYGRTLVDMHFLPDVWVVCPACEGRRYRPEASVVRYAGLTIDEVLGLTVAEAVDRLTGPEQLGRVLTALADVGLGYLQLGQSATELSGGEAQRLKLAAAIQRGATGRTRGLVVLDEPTAGLHPADTQRLVDVVDDLVTAGNTVVLAEHDLGVAAASDWIIDLGPGAGRHGGSVVAAGTPQEVATADTVTARHLRRHLPGPTLPDPVRRRQESHVRDRRRAQPPSGAAGRLGPEVHPAPAEHRHPR
ncbi:excinuclease ABC subunit UvrA [Pseudonocardia abyssalis]|uniref:Excinuclease ABC subunit UvrA n=1 Tax=Pseudonocardia abyssalis TaxID=2792008 RepID=A0ABS6UZW4_9PSEU|nr:excinuclease ABC subunit UvrA [Pseudonocardia abyssalis]MBW0115740.1 excinuclease ABC subunit UvrA [Pseudonocardia abyssalis]MBW0137413.1 excinuclease ABC subunit UvrA [Pseudonocardia abyssalis]